MDLLLGATKEVQTRIYPFWKRLIDEDNGGFYGRVDFSLRVIKDAPKGVILNSRILYFFSQYYICFHDEEALRMATHAYNFLKDRCYDRAEGGVYWSLDYLGEPIDKGKHTYSQSFAIYGLATYYKASHDEEALALALSLYETMESKCREPYAPFYYKEAQSRDWKRISNDKLSEDGVMADRTMNTALHILEAYTALYDVHPFEKLKENIISLLHLFITEIYDETDNRLDVFFSSNYDPLLNMESYGHEIEASWLLTRAVEVIGEESISQEVLPICVKLAKKVYEVAYKKPFIINQTVRGQEDDTRVWWVEAEGVNGFLNLASLLDDPSYKKVAEDIFLGIEDKFVDKRPGGCWFWDLDSHDIPSSEKDIVEPWKCPYHNGRMCFEAIRRLRK